MNVIALVELVSTSMVDPLLKPIVKVLTVFAVVTAIVRADFVAIT